MSSILENFSKFKSNRFYFYLLIIFFLYLIKFKYTKYLVNDLKNQQYFTQANSLKEINNVNNNLINFENFNNNTGLTDQNFYIVPNIVHYVHLNQAEIKFPLFLSILSVWLNQNPKFIYLHCNDCDYKGKYWNELNRNEKIKSILKIKKIFNFDSKIFTQTPGWIHHKSDTLRLLALMNYGGIYLDNDMILVKSLDKYRRFEIAVSWDSDVDGIGNQVIIANRNSRLLRAMYDGMFFRTS